MKSRYDLMQDSLQRDSVTGEIYPDVLTLPLDQLEFTKPLKEVKVNQRYKSRFYNLCFDQWGICYYDDILLFMNGVSLEDTLEINEVILVPTLSDMNSYYSKNLVSKGE